MIINMHYVCKLIEVNNANKHDRHVKYLKIIDAVFNHKYIVVIFKTLHSLRKDMKVYDVT